MAQQGDAVVRLSVDAGQLSVGLGSAQTHVQQFAQRASGIFREAAGAAGSFNRQALTTAQSAARFKESIARSRETAMFFTSSLQEFGPAGRTAQMALSGVAGAMLGGGGVLFALEAVRVAVRFFTEQLREQEEAANKAAEALRKVSERVDTLAAANANAARALATGISENVWANYDKGRLVMDQLALATERLNAARARQARIEAMLASPGDDPSRLTAVPADVLAETEAAAQAVATLQRELQELGRAAGVAIGQSDATNAGKVSAAAAKDSKWLTEGGPVFNPWNPWAPNPDYDRAWADMSKNTYFHGGDNEGGALAAANKAFSAGKLKDAKAEADAFQKSLDLMAQKGALLGETFGSLGTVISNSFGQAAGQMTAMFGKLIQQAIQLAVAMSSTAGPLGWLNAAAAAAALMATISSVPEMRAAGGSVAAGRPYIVGELGPELFVPSGSGSIVPNHKLGGGTVKVTNVIQAWDGRDTRRALDRSSREIARSYRQAIRRGQA